MKHVLFTSSGNPRRGSWQMRGQQLGNALGAVVKFDASEDELRRADVVVLVKHGRPHGARCKVLDVLDPWPQPHGNSWKKKSLIKYIRSKIDDIRPDAVVFPTEAMQADVGNGYLSTVLYHHGEEDAKENPIRERVSTVGFAGSKRYLEGWEGPILEECENRGWQFRVNCPLAEMDIVLAVRGNGWRGYPTDYWKSNVKLANAQLTGTPIIALKEAGYLETEKGGVVWINSPKELSEAFDMLEDYDIRRLASIALRDSKPRLRELAAQYRNWIESL